MSYLQCKWHPQERFKRKSLIHSFKHVVSVWILGANNRGGGGVESTVPVCKDVYLNGEYGMKTEHCECAMGGLKRMEKQSVSISSSLAKVFCEGEVLCN